MGNGENMLGAAKSLDDSAASIIEAVLGLKGAAAAENMNCFQSEYGIVDAGYGLDLHAQAVG